jgi:hypothetical protein
LYKPEMRRFPPIDVEINFRKIIEYSGLMFEFCKPYNKISCISFCCLNKFNKIFVYLNEMYSTTNNI